jgi:hypothetical protein
MMEIKIPLGAYQRAEVVAADLGDQFTESGQAPRSALVTLVGNESFQIKTVTLALSERAQRDLILALEANLGPESERTANALEYFEQLPYAEVRR